MTRGKPADLTNMDLRSVTLPPKRPLTALIAPGALMYGLDLQDISLQGSNLQGADLRGVNLAGAKLNHADLRGAQIGPLLISDARLLAARLDRAIARYADFRGADLRRAQFPGRSDLRQSHRGRPSRGRNRWRGNDRH